MKMLIVDDSIVFRTAISKSLESVPGIQVFKTVSNGKIAIDVLKQNPDIDLITLDMEMPVMDGLTTIKEIRKFNKKVRIIVFSSLTTRGAEKTIDALSAGADDFVAKIEGKTDNIEDGLETIREELLPKIKAFFDKSGKRLVPTARIREESTDISKVDISRVVAEMPIKPKLICIGCSTGGPDALNKIFKAISGKISIPILLVQHMPPVFTAKLASMLNQISGVEIIEAKKGDKVLPGHCYIAPGDYHMLLSSDGTIDLNQAEKVCFVRPAVDVLFESVAKNYKEKVLAIVLTGMGDDGANGCVALKDKGAEIFIQDEASSIVWGMPGSVHRKGVGAKILPIEQIAPLITEVSKRI